MLGLIHEVMKELRCYLNGMMNVNVNEELQELMLSQRLMP